MFFTKTGLIIAWIVFVFGVLRAAMGYFVVYTFDTRESMIAATKRYLGTTSPGEAIDQGLILIAVSLVIGILAEISKNSRY